MVVDGAEHGVDTGQVPRAQPVAAARTGSERAPWRVLVADDATGIRRLVCLLLGEEEDFVVVGEVADGAAAVEEAQRLTPDLVLLDLAMPEKDGLEAMREIRERVPQARVVVFSGFGASSAVSAARLAGADDYLEKGVPVSELLARLRAVCARPPRD